MKTDFVPKLVAGISACCAVYAAVTVADRLLTVRILASVGYFDALVRVVPVSAVLYHNVYRPLAFFSRVSIVGRKL